MPVLVTTWEEVEKLSPKQMTPSQADDWLIKINLAIAQGGLILEPEQREKYDSVYQGLQDRAELADRMLFDLPDKKPEPDIPTPLRAEELALSETIKKTMLFLPVARRKKRSSKKPLSDLVEEIIGNKNSKNNLPPSTLLESSLGGRRWTKGEKILSQRMTSNGKSEDDMFE